MFSSMKIRNLEEPLYKKRDESTRPNLERVYAFRTLTTMLSLTQSRMEITNTEWKPGQKDLVKQLKVLNALAAVVIREGGVAAAIANPVDGTGIIRVLVSITLNTPLSPHSKSAFKDFLTPQNKINPTKSERHEIIDPVTLVDPRLVNAQESDNTALLRVYLTHCWRNEKIETHIWMLNRLLERLRTTNDLLAFLLYVIAACYPKMQLRMKNLAVSVPNRTALKDVPVQAVKFSQQSHKLKDDEKTSDLLFLSEILKIHGLENQIPNLTREANNAKTLGYSYHFDFYTKDTWTEYHLLLCTLLERFWDGLESLNKLQSTCVNDIIDSLDNVVKIGSALRAMVRGGAIKKHLQLVASFLPQRPTVTKLGVKESEDDVDEELCVEGSFALHQGQSLPNWKAFNNWLVLMVTHFDAVQVLANFVLKSPVPIVNFTIKYLSPSRPDRAMLSWKTLLLRYLPASDSDSPSTEEIINFLSPKSDENNKNKNKHPRRAVSTKEMEQIVELVQVIEGSFGRNDKKDYFSKAVGNLIRNLKRLDWVAPRWELDAKAIITALEPLKQTSSAPDLGLITQIAKMVEDLNHNTPLYNFVRDDGPDDIVAGFEGKDHCEICLAACGNTELGGFFEGGQFIGVSKRCCPVCAHLLTILKTRTGMPYIVRGKHSKITACSLPESLTKDTIDEMILEFGMQLRKELVFLMQGTEGRSSIHSLDFSVDSHDSYIAPTYSANLYGYPNS